MKNFIIKLNQSVHVALFSDFVENNIFITFFRNVFSFQAVHSYFFVILFIFCVHFFFYQLDIFLHLMFYIGFMRNSL